MKKAEWIRCPVCGKKQGRKVGRTGKNRFTVVEREQLEARNREIDDMFLNLYTDKANGILSEHRFVKLTAAMELEQEENQKQLKELALSLRHNQTQSAWMNISSGLPFAMYNQELIRET